MIQSHSHFPSGTRKIPKQVSGGGDQSVGLVLAGDNGRNLSAIKLRGEKRPAQYQHQEQQQSVMKSSLNALATPSSPKRGRRLSPAAIPFSPSRKTHHIRRIPKTPLWPPSRLENLPTEVLELIFLHALNINFPRASLRLGQRLSSDFIHKELLLRTCTGQLDDDETKDPCPETARQRRERQRERAKIQTFVLSRKWLTLDFLRPWIPDHMISTLLRVLSFHALHWLDPDGPLVTLDLERTIRAFITNLIATTSSASSTHDPPPYIEHYWIETLPEARRILLGLSPSEGLITLHIHNTSTPLPSSSNNFAPTTSYHRHPFLALHSQTQIPPRLLHGPWSHPSSKLPLLELLLHANASIDWIATTSGEIAEAGFLDAINENNARALRALCVSNSSADPTAAIIPGERKDAAYHLIPSRGVGVIPEQKHLLMAIQQGCNEEIVETLLNAPESRADLQDGGVVRLMAAMWAQEHPMAGWLRDRVEVDRTRRLRPGGKGRRGRAEDWLGGVVL